MFWSLFQRMLWELNLYLNVLYILFTLDEDSNFAFVEFLFEIIFIFLSFTWFWNKITLTLCKNRDFDRQLPSQSASSNRQKRLSKNSRKYNRENQHSSFDDCGYIDHDFQPSSSVPFNTEVNDRHYHQNLHESRGQLQAAPAQPPQLQSKVRGFSRAALELSYCQDVCRPRSCALLQVQVNKRSENYGMEHSASKKLKQQGYRDLNVREESHEGLHRAAGKPAGSNQLASVQEFTNLPEILAEDSNAYSSMYSQSRENCLVLRQNGGYEVPAVGKKFPRIVEQDEDEEEDKYRTSMANHMYASNLNFIRHESRDDEVAYKPSK